MNGVLITARLKDGAAARYDELHRHVPHGVVDAIRSSGITDWTIWRDGPQLHQLIICRDLAQFDEANRAQPPSWLEEMRHLVDLDFPAAPPLVVDVPWMFRSK